MNEDHKVNLVILISLEIFILLLFNITRVVWKKTETISDGQLRVACLEGGGQVRKTDLGTYGGCRPLENINE